MNTMRAIIKEDSAPGATLRTRSVPVPGPGEVLMKIKAAAICGTDLHILEWNEWARGAGLAPPFVLGHECSAEVVEAGPGVKTLVAGDYVACDSHVPCGTCYQCLNGQQHICARLKGFGVHMDGCFAEYAVIPEVSAVRIPWSIHPHVGALLEPLGTSVRACIEAEVSGKHVAVIGCGPIGLLAIGAAKALGAASITGVDVNAYRLGLASQMGATRVVDSSREEVPTVLRGESRGAGVDAVIECSGNPGAIVSALQGMRKGGKVALVGLPSCPVSLDLGPMVVFKEATLIGIHGRRMFETWTSMSNLLDRGLLDIEPVITHVMGLDEFDKGCELLRRGEAGKVILVP